MCAYILVYVRVYTKYARMIRVCVVRLYLSCTVNSSSRYVHYFKIDIIVTKRYIRYGLKHFKGKEFASGLTSLLVEKKSY